ncbi:YbaB/EbfC family nucleoid-associated protein [Saccharomonospora azurea]|uniref:YbaB/EbfC DNA-binding family protein n=1 Tax=Saccharomonospora azurea NA-128 TaxID=882081 RepID=H8GE51_9PSEU|nr:YbaB/EbfC family nucleoid-associated protein [Saccharomonospora azurea]EHK89379.1 hypothetical protein SZMC14600_00800 [Saccharomonospora azurea SZMC 14600]EHY90933.1 hypothetical protein SacazDRAFT_04083 [Saccharomonospora azurea NA-128]
MTSPDDIQAMKDRLRRIRQNPEQALFSEFKGESRSGVVTVWVDMLGRQKRVHIAPGTVRDGDEQWLTDEINSAYAAAAKAATLLDFDLASLASELENAPRLRAHVESTTRPPQESRREERPGDDEFFDGFGVRG